MRFSFGVIAILLLILRITKISMSDLVIFLCAIFLLGTEFLWQRSETSNILSYYALTFLYVLLFIALKNSELNRKVFLGLWIRVAYFLSITSILLFFLHQFTPFNTDFLHFSSWGDFSLRDLKFSILGVTGEKNFGFMRLQRSYGYFAEPQFAGLYFSINILLAREIDRSDKYKKLLPFTVLAGLLTFSVTFYVGLLLIYVLQAAEKWSRFQFVAVSIFLLFIVLPIYIFSENIFFSLFGAGSLNTSYDDREIRMLNAINILRKSSFVDLLMGHGVGFKGGADRGLAMGFFHVLVERGLTGLLFVMSMLAIFVRRNFMKFAIFLLYFFAFTWYVNYIFWFGALALWTALALKPRLQSS